MGSALIALPDGTGRRHGIGQRGLHVERAGLRHDCLLLRSQYDRRHRFGKHIGHPGYRGGRVDHSGQRPAIWLGSTAVITIAAGADPTLDTSAQPSPPATSYAIRMGDGSKVTIDGVIKGRGGITGPTQVSGSTGFSNATIILNSSGKITTSGTANNAALDGRAGTNIYQIDGDIDATGVSGTGIAVGNNDVVTIGATGSITTRAGDTSDAISGFGRNDVKVTMDEGSQIEIHGIGTVSAISRPNPCSV